MEGLEVGQEEEDVGVDLGSAKQMEKNGDLGETFLK